MSAKRAEVLDQSWPEMQGRSKPQICFLGLWPSRRSHWSRGWGWGRDMKMVPGVAGCGLPRYSPCPSSRLLPCQYNGTVPSTEPLERGWHHEET